MISVGIHIKKHSFTTVELAFSRGVFTFKDSYEQFFDESSTEEQRNVMLLEHLQKIEAKYQDTAFRLCYSLSQDQVSSFFVQFPFKEKFKILKALPFEIEDKSPFRSHKTFYYGKITKLVGNKSYVVCFITLESYVKNFLKTIKPLKTQPYLLSVEGSALANIVQGCDLKPSLQKRFEKPSLYIYMDFYRSVVLVFKEGHLCSVSHLDWGFHPIIKDIEKKYKLTFKKSVEQFFDKSFILTSDKGFTKEQVAFSNLIKKQISVFVHQVKMLKLSLETENNISFDEVFIYGPGSVVKNLSPFLSLKMETQVSKLKSIRDLPYFDLGQAQNHNFLVALGTAMEGLKRLPYEGVNFLHNLQKESVSLFSQKWKSAMSIVVAMVICFSGYSFVHYRESLDLLGRIETVFSDYGRKIARLKRGDVNPEGVREYLKRKEGLLSIKKKIQNEKKLSNPIDHIKTLTEQIRFEEEWNLKITALKIKGSKVTLKGEMNRKFDRELRSYLKGVTLSFQVRPDPSPPKSSQLSQNTSSQDSESTKDTKRFHYELIMKGGG